MTKTYFKMVVASLLLAGSAWSDGTISAFDVSGTTIELTIKTTPGKRYILQGCSDLTTAEWGDIGTRFLATGTSTNRAFSNAAPTYYYRAVEVVLKLGRINSISVAGNSVVLDVATKEGGRYILQECTDLTVGVWSDLGVSFGEAGDSTSRSHLMEAPSCYYRVVELTSPAEPIKPPPPPPGG